MKTQFSTTLRLGTALAALTAATPLYAQDAAGNAVGSQAEESATTEDGEEVITVTARRTEESLQRVPAAVTAFNERGLERIQAQDTTGLQGAVPNLNIVQGRGSSNATNIFIRGIGQPDALQTFDPAVGVYVDGVYFSRIRGTQFDLLDLQRVEVLRGPQGTLYGKNTIGGALSFVTRRPGNEFRGELTATYGAYDQFEVRGVASGPLTDTIGFGIAALHAERDGYVEDAVLDREYNDKNTEAVRGTLAFTPSSNVRIDVTADYSEDDAAMTVGQPQNTLTYLLGGNLLVLPTAPEDYDFTGRTTPSLPNSTKMEHWGTSLNAAVDVSEAVTLRSITAYRELQTDDYIDIDATQVETGDVFVGVDQNQFSQELQVNINTDRLTAVGGLYYLREHVISHQEAYADDLLGPLFGNATFLRTVDDDLETTSWAAYANASYEIVPDLRIALGARYTQEEKEYFRTTSTFSSFAPLTANPAFVFDVEETWDNFSPMASVDYQIDPDTMIYARIAKGFKSGGFNGRANNPGERAQYDPETVTSYEIGLRTTFADQLRFNLTAFYNDYRDFQARVSSTGTDPVTGLPAPLLSVLNAGRLSIKGAELEVAWTPIRGLLIDSQIGYLDSQYEEFDDVRFPGGSRAFQTPPFAPDWTIRFGAQYEADLGGSGFLTTSGQLRYRSEHALAIDNTTISTNPALVTRLEGMFQEGYWLGDARVVWENPTRSYHVGLYVNNLFDTAYKADAQEFSNIGSIRTAYYGPPRTWYIRAGVRF
jgi:iron complex outermembrane recepter protein